MKALTVKMAGNFDTLKIVELPTPKLQPNEILIEQSFAGINYGDAIRIKRGLFALNEHGYFIPGFEGVGKVVSVGNSVKNFNIGDRVSYLSGLSGGYSQQISIDEGNAFRVSDNISDEIAAVMTCVGTTAWNLTELSNVKKDDWVLVHGATGGVGLLLVQLCLLKGAKVIAIVGTQEKAEFIKRYSPTSIIIRGEENIIPQISSLTDGYGIDAIFDCVGQAVLGTNLSCIRKGGVILYYGSTSGHSEYPGMQVLMNSLRIQGFNIFNLLENEEMWKNSVQALMSLLVKNKLDIYIDKVFNMEQAHEAHQLLEDRHSIGKFLINIGGEKTC